MIINLFSSHQFNTRLWLNNTLLDQVNEAKLLGVILQDNLSWEYNTRSIVIKAYQRMIILRRLSEFQVKTKDIINIYVLFIRSLLEQSSVVWSSSLTIEQQQSLERVQKIALRIIYQNKYLSYENALNLSQLTTLEERYEKLLFTFAVKCTKNNMTKDILPLNTTSARTRLQEKYHVPFARKTRYMNSTIPKMAQMMNTRS